MLALGYDRVHTECNVQLNTSCVHIHFSRHPSPKCSSYLQIYVCCCSQDVSSFRTRSELIQCLVSSVQSTGDELLHDQLRHLTKSRGGSSSSSRGFGRRRSGSFVGGGFGGDDDDDDEGFIGTGDFSVFLFFCLSSPSPRAVPVTHWHPLCFISSFITSFTRILGMLVFLGC
jgi:hypothetical protein